MKNDNRGLTLIELIIVIAIISVLLGFFIVNLDRASYSAAKGCSNEIKTAIGQTRIKTMGKQETYLYIYKDGNKYMMQNMNKDSGGAGTVTEESPTELASNKVNITYELKNKSGGSVTGTVDGSSTGYLLIGFDRETGKLDIRKPSEGGQITISGDNKNLTRIDNEVEMVITITSGNNIYDITTYTATGKVEIAKR